VVAPVVVPEAVAAPAASPAVAPALGPDGLPRKRRRRGGRGRRREVDGVVAESGGKPASVPVEIKSEGAPLLTRLKDGIKGLLNRLPGRGRQR
jgi:hypothetical protein